MGIKGAINEGPPINRDGGGGGGGGGGVHRKIEGHITA